MPETEGVLLLAMLNMLTLMRHIPVYSDSVDKILEEVFPKLCARLKGLVAFDMRIFCVQVERLAERSP
jgi:hypothetical protein